MRPINNNPQTNNCFNERLELREENMVFCSEEETDKQVEEYMKKCAQEKLDEQNKPKVKLRLRERALKAIFGTSRPLC